MPSHLTTFDRDHVVATLRHLHEPGSLIEMRRKVGAGMRGSFSCDPEEIADWAAKLDGTTNIYVTLNEINPTLVDLGKSSSTTTKDVDIIRRRWLFLDFDPCRPKDTASTDEQLANAKRRAISCAKALIGMGWPAPTAAYSGNGMHLLWALEMEAGKGNNSLVKDWTYAVAHRWGDNADAAALKKGVQPSPHVHRQQGLIGVDKSVHNVSRIIKLWGTKSVKGQDTTATPLRYSTWLNLAPRNPISTDMMLSVIAEWGEKKPTRPQRERVIRPPQGKSAEIGAVTTEAFDMQGWLDRFGIAVREVKIEADRTMYVLTHCVFDPSHASKDAAVFVSQVGQKGYHCFHDSCADKTWADVRAQFDECYAERRTIMDGDLPVCQVNERRAVDVVTDVVRLLAEGNNPPTLFQGEGQLLALRTRGGVPRLVPLGLDTLRVESIQRMSFVQKRTAKNGEVSYAATWPTRDLLQSVLSLAKWDDIPVCEMVTDTPLFACDGTIHSEEGYNPSTRAYLTTEEFAFRRVPGDISREEAFAARDWLFEWPLSGFPFDSDAGRAHALGVMLQHSVTRLISANMPLVLIDASAPGSGKGLLAEAVAAPSCPRPTIMALPVREEERQKTIVSTLLDRPTHVIWDNVKGAVESATLEALLTAPTYSARVLGHSDNVALPVTGTTWMMTANNATLSPDLATRSVYVRLDPGCERPEERTDFKILSLPLWLAEHRAEMVEKVMTIVAFWVGQGMPPYLGRRRHRLERWCSVVGGILESVGLGDDFLANTDALRDSADTETGAWTAFVGEWAEHFGSEEIRVTELMPIAFGQIVDPAKGIRDEGPLELFISSPTDAQRKVKLGLWLKERNGRVYAGHKIVVRRDKKRGNSIHLEPLGGGGITVSGTLAEQISAINPASASSADEHARVRDSARLLVSPILREKQ